MYEHGRPFFVVSVVADVVELIARSAEHFADRFVMVDSTNRLGQQRRDRHHMYLVKLLFFWQRERVGDAHAIDWAFA